MPGLIEEGHRSHHLHIGHMLQDLGDAVDTVASDTDFAARLLNYARRIAPSVSAYHTGIQKCPILGTFFAQVGTFQKE